MQTTSRIALTSLLVIAVGTGGFAQPQAQDPRIGTWELNVAKSTFTGRAPTSDTRTFELVGDEIAYTARGIDADGKPSLRQWKAKADGKDYPFTGSSAYDSISSTRLGASSWESAFKKAGQIVMRGRSVISADGKTMTATLMNAEGKEISTMVFEKQ